MWYWRGGPRDDRYVCLGVQVKVYSLGTGGIPLSLDGHKARDRREKIQEVLEEGSLIQLSQ